MGIFTSQQHALLPSHVNQLAYSSPPPRRTSPMFSGDSPPPRRLTFFTLETTNRKYTFSPTLVCLLNTFLVTITLAPIELVLLCLRLLLPHWGQDRQWCGWPPSASPGTSSLCQLQKWVWCRFNGRPSKYCKIIMISFNQNCKIIMISFNQFKYDWRETTKYPSVDRAGKLRWHKVMRWVDLRQKWIWWVDLRQKKIKTKLHKTTCLVVS